MFIARDIDEDAVARKELIERYWRLATPTIVIGGRVFTGFRDNRREIEKLLDELQKREEENGREV